MCIYIYIYIYTYIHTFTDCDLASVSERETKRASEQASGWCLEFSILRYDMRSLALSLSLSLLNQTSLSLSLFLHRCLFVSFSLAHSLSLMFASSLLLSLCLIPLPHTPTLSYCTLIAVGSSSCYGSRSFTRGASKSCRRVRAVDTFACGRKQILACTSCSHRLYIRVCVCVCVCMYVCV